MKKTPCSRIFIIMMMTLCAGSMNACSEFHEKEAIVPERAKFETIKSDDETSENTMIRNASPKAIKWQANLSSDIPAPYIEVLQQYEDFVNADNQDVNDESVQAMIRDGEWKYLYDELCMSLASFQNRNPAEDIGNIFHYFLTDLTGDGFPEMIIAYGDTPEVIYNYSESNGIGMECASCYFVMTIYQNGIVEYVSGGAYSSTTWLRFSEDTESWGVADRVAVLSEWDAVRNKMNNLEYYTGEWGMDGLLDQRITEEEYFHIQEKYVTEQMEFTWIPLMYQLK